ncbi:MAG: LemA family protein [Candidatus Babeliaceae bacterium]|jgi:LemA protein
MNNILIIFLAVVGLVALIVFYGINIYNNLVRLSVQTDEGWSGIDVQLKRRYDLIPNLVAVVKQYGVHEKEIFQKVAELRSVAMGAHNIKESAVAEGELTRTLKTLFAVAENYPELKANQNFLDLQKQLATIEQEIQLSRRYYNATARDYNTVVHSFPAHVIASKYGFTKRDYFQLDEVHERKAPTIEF